MTSPNLSSTEQEFKAGSTGEDDDDDKGQSSQEEARDDQHADASCSDQQELVCSDEKKDSGCPALQSFSVSCQISEEQRLGELTPPVQTEALGTMVVFETPTGTQTPDGPDESYSTLGTSRGDQDDIIHVAGLAADDQVPVELTQEQQLSKQRQETQDLFEEERDQGSEHQEDNQEQKSMENEHNETQKWRKEDGAVPTLMITTLEEALDSTKSQEEDIASSEKGTVSSNANRSASPNDAPDFGSSDLQSITSDNVSLLSETVISVKSYEEDTRSSAASSIMEGLEEDTRSIAASSIMEGPEEDTRSVTASSVMSLFPRMQMDPVEREWLRCAALGNVHGLRQLLLQDSTLASKKDFVTTALHWAAKQGRIETVDMMARSGADVNQRAGYTPLHLASLHGHAHIIQLLVNNYNAKVNIRDYHGKIAAHYWNGNLDIFNKPGSQTGGKWTRGRRGQRYVHLPALLSRSRSQGSLYTDLGPGSLELTPHPLSYADTTTQALLDTF